MDETHNTAWLNRNGKSRETRECRLTSDRGEAELRTGQPVRLLNGADNRHDSRHESIASRSIEAKYLGGRCARAFRDGPSQ
jgi:hypothetical protein